MVRSLHVVILYLLTHLGLIFFMFPSNIIASTQQGHWLPILIGIFVHVLFLHIYMKGLNYFPGENLISIFSGIGKWAVILLLVPVLLYFFIITLITVRAYSEIITLVFLSFTPLWAVTLLLLIVSTYVAKNGMETVLRTGILLAIIFLPLFLFVFILSFQNVDWRYFNPVRPDLNFLTSRSYYESFFVFSGGFLFLGFVQPYFSYERKYIIFSALLLIPFFIFSVYIPILTLGQATASVTFLPFVVIADSINVSWLMFDRVTLFFLLSLISFMILYISLVMCKTILIINRYVPSIKPVHLLYLLSSLLFFLCFLIPDWKDVEKLFWWNTLLRFYVFIAVPLSIYFWGVRKRNGKHETI
ncbi:GerAB/ArcD/ProY family transporter [Fredinandcohnia sp. FSL W7-1320]|uniref:GerAB/ArcD/ProY family transporter n=1 Tax=Fredinandcohnia sp. FSL W7-1320 TaxID=2954540 RepID=UPI001FE418A7